MRSTIIHVFFCIYQIIIDFSTKNGYNKKVKRLVLFVRITDLNTKESTSFYQNIIRITSHIYYTQKKYSCQHFFDFDRR